MLSHLLLLMVLSSAAASTQTTILPTARTSLAMAVYQAIPSAFARVHRRFLTPTVSTVVMGAASIVLYVVMNYISAGTVISDAVSALGVMIAFYYGLTGFSCAWYYRPTLTDSAREPLDARDPARARRASCCGARSATTSTSTGAPVNSYTSWQMPFWPHWDIGGVFLIDLIALVLGVVLMFVYAAFRPPFFRGEVLNSDTPTLVPDDLGVEVGMFRIDESQAEPDGVTILARRC